MAPFLHEIEAISEKMFPALTGKTALSEEQWLLFSLSFKELRS